MMSLRTRCRGLGDSGWRIVAIGLLAAVMAAACGGAPAMPTTEPVMPTSEPATPTTELVRITVTFEGDQCIYHGPERVPAGRMRIVLDVRDQTAYEEYGVGAATVDEGKTIEDLVAAPFDYHAPVWVHDQAFVEAAPGTSQETPLVLFEGPLFLVCATSDGKTNVLGPIEVEPLVKK
jgi:hypothetical protein